MSTYDSESALYQLEVDQEAVRLIRKGIAAPWDAIAMAAQIVRERRKADAERRFRDALRERQS